MNHGTGRPQQFSPAEISTVLARYHQSGLGVVQFAHEQGIPPGRLHYWIYQKGRTRRSEPQRVSLSKPVFQELQVATMLPAVDSWIAEVNLPGGLAIRFSQKAAAEWIGSVVQALRRPC
jgi:hypothetical protein